MAETEKTPAVEYSATAASSLINGEVKLSISERGLLIAAILDATELPFVEINELRFENYNVVVVADCGAFVFTRMGQWAERFYGELCAAYNEAVLRSLFIKGKPLVTAKGDYHYLEGGAGSSGQAPFFAYDNCVALLPPNLGARRIPLCFMHALDKGNFTLTLSLDTQESYTLAKLGYDTDPFEKCLEAQLRSLQEKAIILAKEIDPGLSSVQSTQIAKLTLEGKAAPLGALLAIAPSFVEALELEIAKTRAAEYYQAFKELCSPEGIWIGFRNNPAAADSEGEPEGGLAGMFGGAGGNPLAALGGAGGNPLAALGGLAQASDAGELSDSGDASESEPEPDKYLFFFIVPSPDGKFATIEFSEADSATFVYRTNNDFESFAQQLNRALEAISFKREVIRLSDEELAQPGNADYFMAAKRTASLQFVRGHFVGRAIHASPTAWKKKLLELWG